MKKILFGCLLVLAILGVGMLGLIYLAWQDDAVVTTTVTPETTSPLPLAGTLSADADASPWQIYRDAEQLFSIKVPKSVTLDKTLCEPPRPDGKPSLYQVPTTVLKKGNQTFITVAYRMGKDAEATETEPCHRIDSTLDESDLFIGWKITLTSVPNKASLEKYVSGLFDKTCRIEKLTWNADGKYFDVALTGLEPNQDQCFIDYEVHFRYSEERSSIAMIEGAQDCIFADAVLFAGGDQGADDAFYNQHCYDHGLVASFRFE